MLSRALPKPGPLIAVDAELIRPPMPNHGQHLAKLALALRAGAIPIHNARNAAHQLRSFLVILPEAVLGSSASELNLLGHHVILQVRAAMGQDLARGQCLTFRQHEERLDRLAQHRVRHPPTTAASRTPGSL
jgi:hypothetical protein